MRSAGVKLSLLPPSKDFFFLKKNASADTHTRTSHFVSNFRDICSADVGTHAGSGDPCRLQVSF